jgi:hypothetical protein
MFVDLGRLKAFKGSQNYPVPARVEPRPAAVKKRARLVGGRSTGPGEKAIYSIGRLDSGTQKVPTIHNCAK